MTCVRESLPYEDGGSTVMPNEKGKGLTTTSPSSCPLLYPPPPPRGDDKRNLMELRSEGKT